MVRGRLTLERDRRLGGALLIDLLSGRGRWEELGEPERRRVVVPLLDAVRERCLELGRCRPGEGEGEGVELAEIGARLAQSLSGRRYGRYVVADLRAQAWGELANSYRLAGRLEEAAAAFAHSFEWARKGTGSPPDLARLGQLYAELLSDERRYTEASELLERTVTLYQAPGFGDRGGLARALLTLACVRAREGEPERAVIVLLRAVAVTEPGGELHLPVIHELALNLCASGLPELARALVEANRHRYLKAGKRMRPRLCWLDGKIALGTGEMGQAEACLNTARLAFLRQRKSLDSALVSLDLALVYLQQGRRQEVLWLVEQMLRTLQLASLAPLARGLRTKRPREVLIGQIETVAATLAGMKEGPAF